jgi:hypothetical protein
VNREQRRAHARKVAREHRQWFAELAEENRERVTARQELRALEEAYRRLTGTEPDELEQ